MNATRATTWRILKEAILVKMLLDLRILNLKMHRIYQVEKGKMAKLYLWKSFKRQI